MPELNPSSCWVGILSGSLLSWVSMRNIARGSPANVRFDTSMTNSNLYCAMPRELSFPRADSPQVHGKTSPSDSLLHKLWSFINLAWSWIKLNLAWLRFTPSSNLTSFALIMQNLLSLGIEASFDENFRWGKLHQGSSVADNRLNSSSKAFWDDCFWYFNYGSCIRRNVDFLFRPIQWFEP